MPVPFLQSPQPRPEQPAWLPLLGLPLPQDRGAEAQRPHARPPLGGGPADLRSCAPTGVSLTWLPGEVLQPAHQTGPETWELKDWEAALGQIMRVLGQ